MMLLEFWRSLLLKRYLVCFTVFFLTGIALFDFAAVPGFGAAAAYAALAAGILIMCIAAFVRRRAVLMLCLIYIGAAVCGFAYAAVYTELNFAALSELDGVRAEVKGRIISPLSSSSTGSTKGAVVRIISIDGGKAHRGEKMMVYFPYDSGAEYGDGVSFTAHLSRPKEYLGNFKYRRYLLSKGCCLSAFVNDYDIFEAERSLLDYYCDAGEFLRGKIVEYVENTVYDSELSALLAGIMVGSRDGFSDELYGAMSGSGFMHVAAVSGLHIGFLAWMIMFLFRFEDRRLRGVVIAAVLIIYMAAAAFTPSVRRAVIMFLYIIMSWMVIRTPDLMTSLFLSALILCVINPYLLFNVGFIMSFIAVLFLIVLMPPAEKLSGTLCSRAAGAISKRLLRSERAEKAASGALRWTAVSMLTAAACQIALTPILVYCFGSMAPFSFIGNIVVIPCTMAVFVCAFFCFAVYLVFPAAACVLSYITVYPFLKIIYSTALFFSKLAVQPSSRPGAVSIIIYYLLCAFLPGAMCMLCERLKNRTDK